MISSNSSSYCRHGELHKIENYDKAVESIEFWECHHRLELTLDGEFAHTHKDLKRLRMYYNRPAYELIFLSRSEHKKLHWSGSKNDRRKNAARHVLIEWKEHGKSRANKIAMANKRKAQNAEFRNKLSTATTRVMHDPIKRAPYVKALKEKQILYVAYKQSGGELMWNDWAHQVYTKRNKL